MCKKLQDPEHAENRDPGRKTGPKENKEEKKSHKPQPTKNAGSRDTGRKAGPKGETNQKRPEKHETRGRPRYRTDDPRVRRPAHRSPVRQKQASSLDEYEPRKGSRKRSRNCKDKQDTAGTKRQRKKQAMLELFAQQSQQMQRLHKAQQEQMQAMLESSDSD